MTYMKKVQALDSEVAAVVDEPTHSPEEREQLRLDAWERQRAGIEDAMANRWEPGQE